ncbi:MAG: tetratricopeptide repeat protein [Planctomycetota bacterium]|jgi:tetratricopeptide (TPR) repeat protein/tRNA A-37 threonylcarbamoyl transferase component Bud32
MASPNKPPYDHEAETADVAPQPETERLPVPKKIGHYHVKRVIAAGGMGVVYEAVQEHPRRTVALKIMRHGIASRSALRRFEYESQILARLRHPGIAQVFEAGMHDDGSGGTPFFAMEYIAGARDIVAYGLAKRLGSREKLDLFLKICDAIHHGHQKGIIHRDLKPANILVDSLGQPKIIDFGVARATDSDLAVTTLQTDVGQLVGTMQYMSPEQIEADPHDIDTRSDVYALGVVLYQMLTGQLPYDVSDTVIYEATRMIREQQPKRISSIDRTLRGDVETITLHALEKDRDRRYQSAVELAQDIRRYLTNRTILARPPSLVYQGKTFIRRNKMLVAGVAAVFAALVLGIIGTTTGLVRARTEASTYTAVSGFFEESFASLEARDGPGPNALVRDLLDDAAAQIDSELSSEPEVQARLRWSIGNGYKALTLFDQAETQLRAALVTQLAVLGDVDPDVAQTLQDLASTLWFKGNLEEAEPMFRDCLDMRRELYGPEHEKVARSMNDLAACLNSRDKHEEAEQLYRQALAMRQRLWGDRHELVAQSTNNLGTCLMDQKRYDEAEVLFREAIRTMRSLRGDEHIDVAGGLTNLAWCLSSLDRTGEAEQLYRDALAIKRKALGNDHASVAVTLYQLARLLNTMQQLEEAQRLCREALEIQRMKLEPAHRRTLGATSLLARILAARGDWAEAEAANRELIRLRRLAYPGDDLRITMAEIELARCLRELGRFDEAEPLLLVGLRRIEAEHGPDHAQTKAVRDRLALLYEAWGKLQRAQQYRGADSAP